MKNAILFMSAFLAGCGVGLTQAEKDAMTPETAIFKLAEEVNIAFAPAVAYAQQPKCTDTLVIACHDANVVKIFLRLREEANAAFKVARADPDTAAISTLTAAVRRILAEVQRELLKAKATEASHGQHAIIIG